MREEFSRAALVLGDAALEKLNQSRVLVFGVGGVGGYVCEALARGGVGTIGVVDNDAVALSNVNRQILATHQSVGRAKTDVAKERILSINPDATVRVYSTFFLPETADEIDFTCYDYVVDAIDTVSGKIEIVLRANAAGVPVISCMGTGNKVDPTAFKVADIFKTSVCPLAKVMRKELRARGVKKLKCVYSEEEPKNAVEPTVGQRRVPGSVSFVPGVAGLILAGEVIKDLIG